jgi:predicted polyphosphate/ATP-dependent NAD kinase
VSVGVVANPASGRDIRRLVAGASVFDNAEKGSMVFRLLTGLGATELEFLDLPITGLAGDTEAAVREMVRREVAAIVVLGGDGTHRLVANGCGDTPICALSTGTNNAFPQYCEPTVAGLATGLVAARVRRLARIVASGGHRRVRRYVRGSRCGRTGRSGGAPRTRVSPRAVRIAPSPSQAQLGSSCTHRWRPGS